MVPIDVVLIYVNVTPHRKTKINITYKARENINNHVIVVRLMFTIQHSTHLTISFM